MKSEDNYYRHETEPYEQNLEFHSMHHINNIPKIKIHTTVLLKQAITKGGDSKGNISEQNLLHILTQF